MRALRGTRVGYALLAGCVAVVFLASVVDPPTGVAMGSVPEPLGFPLDKWVHAGTYAGLAGLLCHVARVRTARAMVLAVAVVATYGFAIEVVQASLPARSFELADVAANTVGATLSTLAWRVRLTLVDR